MTDASEPPPSAGERDAEDDWQASAGEFFDARLELFRLEARDAGRRAGRQVALVAALVGCAFLFWALLMAGLVGLVATAAGWSWHVVALVLAGLHLLAAGLAVLVLRKGSTEAFPLTRAELLKDRQWLDRLLHKTPPP